MRKPKRKAAKPKDANLERKAGSAVDSSVSISRFELAAIAILLLIGVGLRLGFPSRMSVEHFDEGVYASNIFFDIGHHYPTRWLYAPPLLPALIEWSIISQQIGSPSTGAPSSLAVMMPSLVAGCLTLLAVWWIAKEWFGRTAGLATLTLAALSDFHALYSRTALTESLLVLFLLMALWAMKRSLSSSDGRFVLLAGLFTGFAWWTKYNGWLPLAIGLAGISLAIMIDRKQRQAGAKLLIYWSGVAAVGFAVWSPFLLQLQQFGGYAEVAANHKQYVVGPAGWLSGLERQYANLVHFDGWPICLAMMIAAILPAWTIHTAAADGSRSSNLKRCVACSLVLGALTAWLGSALIMFVLGVGYVVFGLRRSNANHEDLLPLYLLAAWIGGLFLVTPLYHPYPRLTLPWVCGLWIAAGAGIAKLSESGKSNPEQRPRLAGQAAKAIAIVALIALAFAIGTRQITSTLVWQPRTGWQPITGEVIEQIDRIATETQGNRNDAIVFVYGEPALFYHLSAAGSQLFLPAGDLGFVDSDQSDRTIPVFLVAGPHAQRTPSFSEEFEQLRGKFELLERYSYVPSDLVLLNHHHPHELTADNETIRTQELRLYRVSVER